MSTLRRYGWIRDADKRARAHMPTARNLGDLPRQVDWWKRLPFVPSIYWQKCSDCVANMILRRLRMRRIELGLGDFEPSRLFAYWCARAVQGMTDIDAGCQIRDALLCLVTQGVCLESDWPYYDTAVNWEPSAKCFEAAEKYEVLDYRRVDCTSKLDLLDALTIGQVCLGIPVYESFESDEVARTGIVPMPGDNESYMGGHAILITGYDLDAGTATLDNSWGRWAKDGRATIPLDYLTELADDAWLVK